MPGYKKARALIPINIPSHPFYSSRMYIERQTVNQISAGKTREVEDLSKTKPICSFDLLKKSSYFAMLFEPIIHLE